MPYALVFLPPASTCCTIKLTLMTSARHTHFWKAFNEYLQGTPADHGSQSLAQFTDAACERNSVAAVPQRALHPIVRDKTMRTRNSTPPIIGRACPMTQSHIMCSVFSIAFIQPQRWLPLRVCHHASQLARLGFDPDFSLFSLCAHTWLACGE